LWLTCLRPAPPWFTCSNQLGFRRPESSDTELSSDAERALQTGDERLRPRQADGENQSSQLLLVGREVRVDVFPRAARATLEHRQNGRSSGSRERILSRPTRSALHDRRGSGDRERVLSRPTGSSLHDRRSGGNRERMLSRPTRSSLHDRRGSGNRKRMLSRPTRSSLHGRRSSDNRERILSRPARPALDDRLGSRGSSGGFRSSGALSAFGCIAANHVNELPRNAEALLSSKRNDLGCAERRMLLDEVGLVGRLCSLGFLRFEGGGAYFDQWEGLGFFGGHRR
jgi:hypothetical protein